MRGSLYLDNPLAAFRGSIPACAGEPFATSAPVAFMKVYPRVCGGAACDRPPLGTSPMVYPRVCGGALFTFPFSLSVCGLSPRVRGSLAHVLRYARTLQVYPRRVRGSQAAKAI